MSENKISPERIQSLVDSLEFKFERVGQTKMTGCWAFLQNGFQVGYGQSGCVDPKEYNRDAGEEYAKENCLVEATNKLWELEGYRLAMQLNPV